MTVLDNSYFLQHFSVTSNGTLAKRVFDVLAFILLKITVLIFKKLRNVALIKVNL